MVPTYQLLVFFCGNAQEVQKQANVIFGVCAVGGFMWFILKIISSNLPGKNPASIHSIKRPDIFLIISTLSYLQKKYNCAN